MFKYRKFQIWQDDFGDYWYCSVDPDKDGKAVFKPLGWGVHSLWFYPDGSLDLDSDKTPDQRNASENCRLVKLISDRVDE